MASQRILKYTHTLGTLLQGNAAATGQPVLGAIGNLVISIVSLLAEYCDFDKLRAEQPGDYSGHCA